ncbi:hypothetical protein SZ64_10470 [Erythrobacter sp. SG61-1L]|uniref:response regulator transcription factor n=1 Tax=Erythrobacter sp. SG61-1L TaxID=1603897 RepID=UPI0006C8F492|nr:response regulator transcription factor [Erythrobacter sp. SG61-1L]KPL68492.1 hypothetical protein SZ64_10470 [Erythrobacter sp. SG61-1L]
MYNLLVVDDAERVRDFIREGLIAENYLVETAANGEQALALAQETDFDLIILDLMMPVMDGQTACRLLRERGDQTPIMMLTARDGIGDKVQSLRGGADDYLVKPFDFDELLARVEALVRRYRGLNEEADARLSLGDLLIDRESHTVHLAGKEIELTAKEFQIVQLFAENAGKLLSRSRILNKIWGYDADPMTNVVDVYISRIRDKFGWDAENGPIRTLRGVGYRFTLSHSQ